ncbi:hypothetical protein ACLUYJ_21015, partial [Acinetobacter baumannii]
MRTKLLAVNEEIDDIKQRPGSNLPGQYHLFRSQLAAHLQVEESELPFVAELVQVKLQEQAWR